MSRSAAVSARGVSGELVLVQRRGGIVGVLLSIGRFTKRRPLGAIGAFVILVLVITAVFAPMIAPYAYDHQVLTERLEDPSGAHLLGTDNLGRDMFSRIVFGARVSISIGFTAVVISTLLSATIGIVSGYYGGVVDLMSQRVIDIWIALPGIVALVFMIAVLGPSLLNITLLLGVLGSAGASRIVRGAVINMRHSQYMEGGKVIGASDMRMMFRYVLPNVMHVIVVGATVAVGGFILVESSLAFLGLGVPPPFPTWGKMLSVSREYLNEPWLALGPGVALTLAVFSFNVFGDALRDVMDPRMRGT